MSILFVENRKGQGNYNSYGYFDLILFLQMMADFSQSLSDQTPTLQCPLTEEVTLVIQTQHH